MNVLSRLFLLPLAALAPGFVATTHADEGADAALAKLASEGRAAALKLTWDVEGPLNLNGFGAFISREGHALVGLSALATNQKPKVVTADGKTLKFGTILELFPDRGVALMKFDHRPKVVLPLGEDDPGIGDTLALILMDPDEPDLGDVPPVVGNIMAKRRDVSSNLKSPRFIEGLSLGSGLSANQRRCVGGALAIDSEGKLVACFAGIKPYPGQILLTLHPLTPLAPEIEALRGATKGLGHPLLDRNPIDPAVLDPRYTNVGHAMMRRDIGRARDLFAGLMEEFPESLAVKGYASMPLIVDGPGGPLLTLKNLPIDPEDTNKARLYLLHSMRYGLLRQQGKLPAAVEELKAAIRCSPDDCTDMRSNLATLYLNMDPRRAEEAAEILQEVYPYLSDTIEFVEQYERLLNHLGRDKEAEKVNERFYELDSVYRRRRGQ